jgi:hypothetical protein
MKSQMLGKLISPNQHYYIPHHKKMQPENIQSNLSICKKINILWNADGLCAKFWVAKLTHSCYDETAYSVGIPQIKINNLTTLACLGYHIYGGKSASFNLEVWG